MNPIIGEISYQGANRYKAIWLKCPKCGHERWVRFDHPKRPGYTGLCSTCAPNPPDRKGKKWANGYVHKEGNYCFVNSNGHPRSKKNGQIKRAILIAESNIGRYLLPTEDVHHVNGIKDDDRPENILVLTHSEYARLHIKDKPNFRRVSY